MVLTDIEVARCRRELARFLERRRPPPHLRPELDLAYRINGQSVEIVEVRTRYNAPDETYEVPVARATFVRARNRWRVYWKRRDLRWHPYAPQPEVETIGEVLSLVDRDEYACFFG
jgi:hypothetical protein